MLQHAVHTVNTVLEGSSDLATGYLKFHYDSKESVKVPLGDQGVHLLKKRFRRARDNVL